MIIYVLQINTGYQGMMVGYEWNQLVWFCFVFRDWEVKGVACQKGEYCGPWASDLFNSRQSFQLKGSFVCYMDLLQPKWFVYIQYFITLKMFASVVCIQIDQCCTCVINFCLNYNHFIFFRNIYITSSPISK